MSSYLKDLNAEEKRLKRAIELKQSELSNGGKMSNDKFFRLVSEINSLSVDLYTVKSRIDNIGKSVPHLPDSKFQTVINKYI